MVFLFHIQGVSAYNLAHKVTVVTILTDSFGCVPLSFQAKGGTVHKNRPRPQTVKYIIHKYPNIKLQNNENQADRRNMVYDMLRMIIKAF